MILVLMSDPLLLIHYVHVCSYCIWLGLGSLDRCSLVLYFYIYIASCLLVVLSSLFEFIRCALMIALTDDTIYSSLCCRLSGSEAYDLLPPCCSKISSPYYTGGGGLFWQRCESKLARPKRNLVSQRTGYHLGISLRYDTCHST